MGSRSKMDINRPEPKMATGQVNNRRIRTGNKSRTYHFSDKDLSKMIVNNKVVETEDFKVSRKMRRKLYSLSFTKKKIKTDNGVLNVFFFKMGVDNA